MFNGRITDYMVQEYTSGFDNTYDQTLAKYHYPLFPMATIHAHKLGWSKLLHSKLVLWLVDGYTICATSWSKSTEVSKSAPGFRHVPGHQDWWDFQDKWGGWYARLFHAMSSIHELIQESAESTLCIKGKRIPHWKRLNCYSRRSEDCTLLTT